MTRRSESKEMVLFSTPLLTRGESADEYASLRNALELDIRPKGIIEELYLADFVAIVWEIQRLRRCKANLINNAVRHALQNLLRSLMWSPERPYYDEADALAVEWYSSEQAKHKVSALLRRFHLDETAIVTEAIRESLPDLEAIDRMMASLESRRDKVLRCVADCRQSLAERMRQSSDRTLQSEDSLCLECTDREKAVVV
ncbi:hypothetical protein [Bradyrhizobium sp. LMTR 3]|uniref:hypothetical protein n=1 Tax=Bradyrhizobium sp. LMTR 3 TaxID=189873 RepID=UPI000810F1D9|nr:hypothetical protein [Bradyrhizobium sp. LMTR 3]OCK57486.1 hypothetical protein LMTR3_07940 [Bradyrhizobium sp. LMTR 3]